MAVAPATADPDTRRPLTNGNTVRIDTVLTNGQIITEISGEG